MNYLEAIAPAVIMTKSAPNASDRTAGYAAIRVRLWRYILQAATTPPMLAARGHAVITRMARIGIVRKKSVTDCMGDII